VTVDRPWGRAALRSSSKIRRFNRSHDRRGHLFEGRFSAYAIQDESYLEAACRYVLENPVRAGRCDTVEAWQWSDCTMA